MGTYADQREWKEIEKFLPAHLHFTETWRPKEEWWDWGGHRIHLDTFRNPSAKAKIILFHGVGTNGRQMSMIIGAPLAKDGFEVIALDMPLYGMSEVKPGTTVTYENWVQIGNDYIEHERKQDERPVFLYGLSAGGMETYHIACKNKKVKGIIGMTFLDQREPQVRKTTTNNAFWANLGVPLAGLSTKLGFGKMKMKMTICSKMHTLCNDAACLKVMLKDKTSAGNSVPMKFIYSYMTAAPEIEPENFAVCPVLLTQPENDRWTPLSLSKPFLDRIKKVPVRIEKLENGSHYPVEPEALEQLHRHCLKFLQENLSAI